MPLLSPALATYSTDPELTLSNLKSWNYNPDVDYRKIINYAQQHDIQGITQKDTNYPPLLSKYKSSPYLFYYQGNLSLLQSELLGIVGPRMPSEYAQQVMQTFFDKAQNYNICTISGFARGIDQITHRLSLQHKIPTIAVLWGGFAHYLRGKDRSFLEEIIAQGGLVISQFKIGFEPTKWSFPLRNKLIAQLSKTLFLPEAKEKSGSLITTEFAHEYKKEVYSVPASIFAPQSAGIFQKMQEEKIKLISDFDQCLSQHFPLLHQAEKKQIQVPNLSESAQKLYNILQEQEERTLEELLSSSKMEYAPLMQELTLMEMDNLITQIRPGVYRIA